MDDTFIVLVPDKSRKQTSSIHPQPLYPPRSVEIVAPDAISAVCIAFKNYGEVWGILTEYECDLWRELFLQEYDSCKRICNDFAH